MDYRPFRRLSVLSALAKDIVKNPNDMDLLKQLKEHIQASSKQYMEATEKICMPCCFSYIKGLSAGTLKLSSEGKLLLMETLNDLFWKISISNEVVFFNFYTYILVELYDYDTHEVKKVSEEYKNSSLKSMIALMSNIPFELIEEIYSKRNIPKFSQIIYVCTQCIRNETARNLRLTSVNCILAVARVLDDKDLDDKVLRYTCSEMFMFFLPGLSGALTDLALEDVKVGHIIVMNAVRAYGKLVTLVMTDYNGADGRINLSDFNLLMLDLLKEPKKYMFNKKLKGKEEIEEYLSETSKNIKWYRKTDEMLNITMKKLAKLTYHSHDKVRLELAYAASDLIKNCSNTMPDSSSTLVEHLIVLSHDESREIAEISEKSIEQLSKNLSEDHLKVLFESLEDGFYNAIMSLPWKFNSIDNGEKITILNLLIGYLKLFGKYNMHHVMLKTHIIHNLVKELLRITELEKNTISLLEVYTLKELSSDCTFKRPWLNFHFFQEEIVKVKIEILCAELSKYNCFNEICRELLNTYLMEKSMKKEAAYLINSLISGLEGEEQQHYMTTLNEILKVYVDDPSNDDLHVALKLQQKRPEQLKDQIIVVCLITEGIGVISRVLKRKFQPFLLKTLYLVLEKAGSDHPLIRTAGLLTLQNLTRSNGYNEITDLINSNFDYFSFHVQRKLGNALGSKDTVLNVLSVVLQYCNVDVLMPMKNIIEEVLLISCDKYKQKYATDYLKVFKMFILSLRRWFNIEVCHREKIKSRKEKQLEEEPFKISEINTETNDDLDDERGKTAEEMYKEDLEKKKRQVQEEEEVSNFNNFDQEYQKPPPPMHVHLTSLILQRSLHFLPSKEQSRKVLVLEILNNGLEILREHEDELLPVVHQIWSPFVERFSHDSNFLVMRLSTQLLATLTRLSKDFIRSRVVKELLPKLRTLLEQSSRNSYLKDKGAAYRYSQEYKLQKELLLNIGPILYDLDVDRMVVIEVIGSVSSYLSDKQPMELQNAVVDFIKMMSTFDSEDVKAALNNIKVIEEYTKNLERIKKYLENHETIIA